MIAYVYLNFDEIFGMVKKRETFNGKPNQDNVQKCVTVRITQTYPLYLVSNISPVWKLDVSRRNSQWFPPSLSL